MARSMTAALACLALVLGGALLAGCGDDDDEGDGAAQTQSAITATEPAPAETATTPTPSGRDKIEVSMKDVKFVPMKLTAKVGQTVVWTNDDDFPHTVTATMGEDFDSGNVAGGETYQYKLDEAGEIDYVCTIHPNQTGSITVTE